MRKMNQMFTKILNNTRNHIKMEWNEMKLVIWCVSQRTDCLKWHHNHHHVCGNNIKQTHKDKNNWESDAHFYCSKKKQLKLQLSWDQKLIKSFNIYASTCATTILVQLQIWNCFSHYDMSYLSFSSKRQNKSKCIATSDCAVHTVSISILSNNHLFVTIFMLFC